MTFEILKRFFQSRVKRLSPPSKPGSKQDSLPLGLSRDQLAGIQALTEETPYKHYLAALERVYENHVSAMLRGLTHDAYLFQCGVCFALEQIARLPDDLTNKTRELDGRHTADTTTTANNGGAATFTSTTWWDEYQRRARRYDSSGVPIPGD